MLTKQKISDLIYNDLDYMYCDNCRYNTERYSRAIENYEDAKPSDYSPCDDCHRKMNGWAISRANADYLAKKIMECFND